MDDGYDNQDWGESSGMRGSSEMGDVSLHFWFIAFLEYILQLNLYGLM